MDNFNNNQQQPFYNSIQLTDIEWKGENEKALALQNIIKNIFTANPGKQISPWQMRDFLEGLTGSRTNINSVRRSITNLKNEKFLIKTTNMRLGNEGKNEHFYVFDKDGTFPVEHVFKKGESTAADFAAKMLSGSKTDKIFFEE